MFCWLCFKTKLSGKSQIYLSDEADNIGTEVSRTTCLPSVAVSPLRLDKLRRAIDIVLKRHVKSLWFTFCS